jgi:subtilisin family serine protease
MMKGLPSVPDDDCARVWAVNINRPAKAMIWKSTTAIKADAARRLFEVKCNDIRWAIIDSGIDAGHPAFRLRNAKGPLKKPFVDEKGKVANNTRVARTFDFTLIRRILSRDEATIKNLPAGLRKRFTAAQRKTLQDRLRSGRAIDWEFLSPFLEVPHTPKEYERPVFEHGTHVAGILAADWRVGEEANETKFDIKGVCPDIVLYDLRVLDENGESDEFTILAALQFALYLNASSDSPMLHGVNMSLSIRHKVKNFACGCTPVCEESERLVNAGLVVVAAAGNDGYLESQVGEGFSEGYRSISITDPGNAPGVITVGATHRDSPHTYGVSYFSSRGPTGDGRIKPDLVAPGEKITSTVPDSGLKAMDGTSMAAPHVSGAAALLIARHRELMAKPSVIKKILCDTATDLGRERYFQGHGMVDILRAMQSV